MFRSSNFDVDWWSWSRPRQRTWPCYCEDVRACKKVKAFKSWSTNRTDRQTHATERITAAALADNNSSSSSAMAERPRELDQRFQVWVNLRLNYRLNGYFSRHCDMTEFTLTHHMVNKPFLLLGLAAEYRSRRWMRSTLRPTPTVQMFMTLTGELSWHLTAPETISRWLLLKKRKKRFLSLPLEI